jgi:hypothetical protein
MNIERVFFDISIPELAPHHPRCRFVEGVPVTAYENSELQRYVLASGAGGGTFGFLGTIHTWPQV